jgi:hypothetical protein
MAASVMAGTAILASTPANAQVHVGIGIGVPGVHVGVGVGPGRPPGYFYGPGFYPPGPCDAYTAYYAGDCGYAVYNGPIFLGGTRISGPHYYRWYNGQPYFWYRGGWQVWAGWTRVNFNWDHGEGWGWRGGHWDRTWGAAHGHAFGPPADHRDRDHRDDRRDRDRRDDHSHP